MNEAFLTHVRTGRPLVTLKWALTLDGQGGDHLWRQPLGSPHQRRGASSTAGAPRPRPCQSAPGRRARRSRADGPRRAAGAWTDAATPRGSGPGGWASPPLCASSPTSTPRAPSPSWPLAPRPPTPTRSAPEAGRCWRRRSRQWPRPRRRPGCARLRRGAAEPGPVRAGRTRAGLAAAFLRADRADRLFAFVAPKLVGAGVAIASNLGVERMADALTFAESAWEPVGPDVLLRGYLREM